VPITQDVVKELIDYNKRTGVLRWRPRALYWFSSKREWKRWNTRYAGQEAFTYEHRGFRWGCLLGQNYLAHRIVWLWVTGTEARAVKFKSPNRTDLRFSNLVERQMRGNARRSLTPIKTLPHRTRLAQAHQ
jgi:hypothetical protein